MLLSLFVNSTSTEVIMVKQVEYNPDKTITVKSLEPTVFFKEYFRVQLNGLFIYVIPISDVTYFQISD